jgi:hypothetical protein
MNLMELFKDLTLNLTFGTASLFSIFSNFNLSVLMGANFMNSFLI